ncbi:MAG: class I SAM-dependent methyltransferase [Desulfarculus sp.]|nr:class I SAM-dependent methyltransferase [Desulfarculus sp.]
MEPREFRLMYAVEKDHWWFVGKRLAAAALLEGVEPIQGLRLDLGAGTGALLQEHLRRGPALGLENDPLALALAHKRVGPRLARGLSHALPFRDNCAGLVTMMDLLYHQGVDVAATLAECHRVLRPGGFLLVFDSAYQGLMGPHDRAMHGARRFTRPGLSLRLERAGFTVVRATYRNSLLAPGVIARRLAARWRERLRGPGAEAPASDVARPPEMLNRLLLGVMRAEARWLRRHDLVLGTSVCVLGRKD